MDHKLNKKAGRAGLKQTIIGALLGGVLFALGGCGTTTFEDVTGWEPGLPSMPKFSNPFKKPEAKLAGDRVPVSPKTTGALNNGNAVAASQARVQLPAVIPNESWSQPGGTASNAPGHLSLIGGLRRRWAVHTGRGSNSRGKISARPIVHGGRIYTLDTRGKVTALSLNSGGKVWQVNLTPKKEEAYVGFGGGLSAEGDQIIAATGFGYVTALSPSSGKMLWTKKIGEPVRSSPTVAGNKIYVLSSQGTVFCLSSGDGAVLWKYRGLPAKAGFLTNSSPAVSGNIVVVPYPSGEVVALDSETGLLKWTDSLNRSTSGHGFGAMKNAGRPVISDGVVYAVGFGGRMIAVKLADGERIWQQPIQSISQPWVAGNSVYVVDRGGVLMALDKTDGARIWQSQLPAASLWSGPVLAGSRLWLVSSSGTLMSVNAQDGKLSGQSRIGEKLMIAPIVARGHIYLYSDKATVTALN